jgi:hypothetical protein
MVDSNPCHEPAVWGLTRDDGTRRPVSDALKVAIGTFSGFSSARFVPLTRAAQGWSAWPDDPTSLVPNWQVYQVAFDRPGQQRVSVLWNGDGSSLRVHIPQHGPWAEVVDRQGHRQALQADHGAWVLTLPAATAHFASDPDGYYFIGGDPLLLVEDGVDPSTPVVAPSLGDPGAPPTFATVVSPAGGQTVSRGQSADFSVAVRGSDGFADPVHFSVVSWSTQRFPEPKDGSSLPLGWSAPESTPPGQTATLRLNTDGADPGIYYLTIQATGGSLTQTFDLALAVN